MFKLVLNKNYFSKNPNTFTTNHNVNQLPALQTQQKQSFTCYCANSVKHGSICPFSYYLFSSLLQLLNKVFPFMCCKVASPNFIISKSLLCYCHSKELRLQKKDLVSKRKQTVASEYICIRKSKAVIDLISSGPNS